MPVLTQVEGGVQNGLNKKNRVLPLATCFLKNSISV